ncbi:MAG: UDP-N-acetylmuramate: L-alanyl-gamma-D-glutamyl-meso-diaminopimelate ligase, partial [Gammaproteobacteria bacterium]|nr:UDP-N-acetylmuramate: L-alanyl-gamma-D-glutamyl-meso-diaminopimelate ligase [Gammaproteobacteria bacterium]
TLAGLRARAGDARIIAVLEARSNTMKLGVHRDHLAPSLALADRAWFLNSADLGWDLPSAVASLGARAGFAGTVDALVKGLVDEARPGDHLLIMSNGGFGGLHDKLLAALRARAADAGRETATSGNGDNRGSDGSVGGGKPSVLSGEAGA